MLNQLNLLSITGLAVVGGYFWMRFLVQPVEDRTSYLNCRSDSPFGLLDVAAVFLAWMAAPLLVLLILKTAWGDIGQQELQPWQTSLQMLFLAVSQIAACLLIAAFALYRYGNIERVFGIRASSLISHFQIALKTFCMVVPAIFVIQAILSQLVPYKHGTLVHLKENFSLLAIASTWLGAVVAAPLCEELIFRGFLQGWLQRVRFGYADANNFSELIGGWDDPSSCSKNKSRAEIEGSNFFRFSSERIRWWLPVIISSALFSAIHAGGGQGLAWLTLFPFGLALGFLYRWTGSIVPSIFLHFFLNAFTMFWLTLQLVFEPAREIV